MMNSTTYLKAAARDEVVRLLGSQPYEDDPSDLARARHLSEATTRVGIPGLWLEFGVSIGRPTEVPDNVELIDGWFEDTVPAFVETHPEQIAFAHIDCDLYSSTATVFSAIRDQLTVGTVLVFDELFNYDRYYEHEMRALIELGDTGVSWRYLGYVPARYAASIIVTHVSKAA